MNIQNIEHYIPSDAELDALDEFIRLVRRYRGQKSCRRGKNGFIGRRCRKTKPPSVAKFLKRYPEFAKTLRPALEGVLILDAEMRRFRQRYPNVDLAKLYDIT